MLQTKLRSHLETTLPLFVITILPFIIMTSILFLQDPVPWPDEGIFLNTSLRLLHTGTLATSIFGTMIPGLIHHASWYPPLYFYILAGWIFLFGHRLETLRLLSFFISVGALFLFFLSMRTLFSNKLYAPIATMLLSLDFGFSQAAHVARMDMVSFFFLVGALYFYIRGLQHNVLSTYVISGIFCGLNMLTHPLGMLAPAIITMHILFTQTTIKRKIVYASCILFPTILFTSIWLISMHDYFGVFLMQYKLQIERKTLESSFVPNAFENVFAWRMLFTIYVIAFLLLCYDYFYNRTRIGLFLIIGTIITTVSILSGKELWYEVYFQPFIVYIIFYLLDSAKRIKGFSFFYFIIFLMSLASLNLYLAFEFLDFKQQYHVFTHDVARLLPKKGTILISAIPDPYVDIFDMSKDLHFYEFPTVPISNTTYETFLKNVDAVIFSYTPKTDTRLEKYIEKNRLRTRAYDDTLGYPGDVIILKPQSQRQKAF